MSLNVFLITIFFNAYFHSRQNQLNQFVLKQLVSCLNRYDCGLRLQHWRTRTRQRRESLGKVITLLTVESLDWIRTMETISSLHQSTINTIIFKIFCYIPRLSLNKTSTVIGWFLVTCPWSNANVSRPGYNSSVVAPSVVCLFVLLWLSKGKSKYITKHLMYGPSGN